MPFVLKMAFNLEVDASKLYRSPKLGQMFCLPLFSAVFLLEHGCLLSLAGLKSNLVTTLTLLFSSILFIPAFDK